MSGAVVFEDREYVVAHGRSPRGRGSWAFRFITSGGRVVGDLFWTPGSTTFGEAKKLARAEARRRTHLDVIAEVQS